MKKSSLIFLICAAMLACVMPITASAFPILIGLPSTISSGNIWLIVGILVVVIIAAVVIIKKVKSKKNEK